ncbi:MAG: phospholipase/carboxylesterase [Arenicella sp.]|jgi:phospholipase/carboxylesterase
MSQTAKTIELVQGSGDVQHAVIWLHGLGASANDFPPIVPELGLDPGRAIRFIFPQAPDRPITINGGMSMPGWYDIKGANIEDKQDLIGMRQSQVLLEKLIQQQISVGIASSNIILAGFSQGGAVVYHTGLRSKHKLAGMLTLSTYLPFAEQVPAELNKINSDTPIFASHGTYDAMVPFEFGKNSAETLTGLGYKIQWRSYPMEHQVVMEQIQDIGAWMNSVFAK